MDDSKNRNTVIFLVFQEILPREGISKKILSQVKAIESQGYNCLLGRFVRNKDNSSSYYIGDKKIESYDCGLIGKFRKLYSYSKITKYLTSISKQICFLYIRYTQFSNFASVNFIKKLYTHKIRILIEIPTYPYDGEFKIRTIKDYRVFEERITRKYFMSYADRIITFSKHDYIFGKRTIKIQNAINLQNIPIRSYHRKAGYFNLIGVADLAFWHGYDRVIKGISNYNKLNRTPNIRFNIAGGYPGSTEYEKLKKLVSDLKIEDHVIFHGTISGEKLDQLFDISDIAIGCLGCHRKGIIEVQALKNVEYAARGIPFIYSEVNNNFDNREYVFKAQPNDSDINISELIHYIQSLTISPEIIRKSIAEYTWDNQMKKIISEF